MTFLVRGSPNRNILLSMEDLDRGSATGTNNQFQSF